MGYLIGFLALGGLVVGTFGVVFGNRPLTILSAVMLLACLILSVLDTFLASNKGVKGKQTSNWVVLPRFGNKQKKER